MDFLDAQPSRQIFYLTACISLLAHLIALLAPWPPLQTPKPPPRLDVHIEPMPVRPIAQAETAAAPVPAPEPESNHPATQVQKTPHSPAKPVLASPQPAPVAVNEPRFTQAERDDINNFLQSLGPANNAGSNTISVERIPDSPAIDRSSMQAYIDALVSKLYRNANQMPHPNSMGNQTASVRLHINSDGTLKSLKVLDEGDQKEEVEFTLRLLERSAPYAPFSPAMSASIKSLTITFCIRPSQEQHADLSRAERGRAC